MSEADGYAVLTTASSTVPEKTLRDLFQILGEVSSIVQRPSSKGEALRDYVVTFADLDGAVTALRLSGTELGGRPLLVSAKPTGTLLPSGINPLVMQYDPVKADEISKTIYVGNLDSRATEEELKALFATCGPVSHLKIAGDQTQPTRFAFVEFAAQEAVPVALALTGTSLHDRTLKVSQSKNTISKPRTMNGSRRDNRRAAGRHENGHRSDEDSDHTTQSSRRRRRSISADSRRRRDDAGSRRDRDRRRSRSVERRRSPSDRDRERRWSPEREPDGRRRERSRERKRDR